MVEIETIVISEKEIQEAQKAYNITPLKAVNLQQYKSIPLEEMKANPPNPIEYIFYPCLPTQGICWIYAAAGMGKTLFTLNLAYAIASGGKFLNYTCPKPRKVLYVDGEMAYNQLYTRAMMINEREGDMDFAGYLHFLTPDKILPLRMPKIDEEEGQFIYQEKLIQEDFEVVVFDNLSMLASFDENKAHEWKSIGNWLIYLRSLGKTIIMVHHAGKDKNGYRGTSSMMDGADVTISLQPINEEALEEEIVSAKKFKVKYGKNRNFSGQDALPFEVTFKNGLWSTQSMEKSELDMVIEMVHLKMTQMAIAKELNCGQSKIAKLIKKARKFKLLPE